MGRGWHRGGGYDTDPAGHTVAPRPTHTPTHHHPGGCCEEVDLAQHALALPGLAGLLVAVGALEAPEHIAGAHASVMHGVGLRGGGGAGVVVVVVGVVNTSPNNTKPSDIGACCGGVVWKRVWGQDVWVWCVGGVWCGALERDGRVLQEGGGGQGWPGGEGACVRRGAMAGRGVCWCGTRGGDGYGGVVWGRDGVGV